MKINPANITSPKQAKALNIAKSAISRVEDVLTAVDSFDQSESDFNRQPGNVIVDKVMVEAGDGAFNLRRWTDGASLEKGDGFTNFEAKAELPGSWGFIPMGLDAKVSKHENADETSYKIRYKGTVSGPSTTTVKIDKASGEWNVKQAWLGIIPARLRD